MGVVQHAQQLAAYNTDRYPSPAIWSSFPNQEHNNRRGYYYELWDDFQNCPSLTAASGAINRLYMSYIDTSDTIAGLATEKSRGVLRLTSAATDNNAPVVTSHDGNCVMLDDNTSPDNQPLWFEARWRKSSITVNQAAIFMDLTEEARGVDNGLMVDDTAVMTTTIDGIGFRVKQDANELDFTWQKASQANQEMANIISTTNSAAAALAVSTWYKTGFLYGGGDPVLHDATQRIKVIVNNVTYTTYVTATNMAASTFPDGEEMQLAFGLKNGEGTSCTFDVDWVRLAQKMLST